MLTFIRNHRLGVGLGALVLVAGSAWLAFGFFGVHTLFVDDVVDEAGPVFASGAAADEPAAPATPTTTSPATSEAAPDDATTTSSTAAPPTTVAAPQIVTERIGEFTGIGRYDTTGTATVLGDGTGQRFLRFEQFATDNGPDLDVYLVNSSAGGVTDFVNLGELRGNIGDQNYEIPPDVDLDVYDTVVIWCVRFSAGFGEARLSVV